MTMPDTAVRTHRRLLRAALPAAFSGAAWAHPGHEHSLLNLFDLVHAGGALVLLALSAAAFTWLRRQLADRRADLRNANP